MSRLTTAHKLLDESGKGKCSVPMWINGCDAGFCDQPAFGSQLPYKSYRDPYTGERRRFDGGSTAYAPALACSVHGGPPKPIIWTCANCKAEMFGEAVGDAHICLPESSASQAGKEQEK